LWPPRNFLSFRRQKQIRRRDERVGAKVNSLIRPLTAQCREDAAMLRGAESKRQPEAATHLEQSLLSATRRGMRRGRCFLTCVNARLSGRWTTRYTALLHSTAQRPAHGRAGYTHMSCAGSSGEDRRQERARSAARAASEAPGSDPHAAAGPGCEPTSPCVRSLIMPRVRRLVRVGRCAWGAAAGAMGVATG
jgi:hypothetical protein